MKSTTLWWKLIVAAVLVFLFTRDWSHEDTAEKIVRLQREEREADQAKKVWELQAKELQIGLLRAEYANDWDDLDQQFTFAEIHLSHAAAGYDAVMLRIRTDIARKTLAEHYAGRRLAEAHAKKITP